MPPSSENAAPAAPDEEEHPGPWFRRPLLQTALLAILIGAVQISSLFSEELQVPDHEELTNGSVALELLHGHFWQVFALQPRPYCGGCSVDSILLAPLYAVAGPSLFVFRLVPVFFYVAMFVAGFRVLRRHAGEVAGLAFGLLWLFPPYAWLRISFVSYGNHYESALYPLIALNLALPVALAHRRREQDSGDPGGERDRGEQNPGEQDSGDPGGEQNRLRYLGLGAVLGFGVYTCFTAVYAVPAILAVVAGTLRGAPRARWRAATLWTGLGGMLGASPWALYRAATGVNPLTTSIYRDDDLTFGLQYIPHKLASLLAPRQLEAIFGYPALLEGRVLAWGTALSLLAAGGVLVAGLVLARRKPRILPRIQGQALLEASFGLLTASFLALYLGARYFNIEYPGDTWPSPVGLRYLSPLYAAGIPLLALAAQRLWSRGRLGPPLAVMLLLAPLANGVTSRAALLTQAPLSTATFDALGADYPFFRSQGGWQIDEAGHRSCLTDDPRSIAFHQWSIGWKEGYYAWYGRVDNELSGLNAEARLELRARRLAALKPPRADQARAYFQGVGWVFQGMLISPGRGVGEVLIELARACQGMSEASWEIVAQEVLRAPDWSDERLNRASSPDAFVREVIAPLEALAAKPPHDLARAAAWGLGYAVGRRHLIIGRPPPDGLVDLFALAGRRLIGQWDELEPLLRPLPPVPDTLPQRLRGAFSSGFGEALGARWGTRFKDPPLPAGIPASELEVYRSAYRRGEAEYFRRW